MKLNQLYKIIPGLPRNLSVPIIPREYENLQDHVDNTPSHVSEEIDWRRLYFDANRAIITLCNDSGASQNVKYVTGHWLIKWVRVLMTTGLPQRDTKKGINYNIEHAHGQMAEHEFTDFFLGFYGLLKADGHGNKSIFPVDCVLPTVTDVESTINRYVDWLIWDYNHGAKGFKPQTTGETMFYRAFIRKTSLYIYFSEGQCVVPEKRKILMRMAVDQIDWLNHGYAHSGEITAHGWDTQHRLFYTDISASQYRKARIIHLYFLQVTTQIQKRIIYTNFYKEHKRLCDSWIKKVRDTCDRVIKTTPGDMSATSYRVHDYWIDELIADHHKVEPTDDYYAPVPLWHLIKTHGQLRELIKEFSVEYRGNWRYDLSLCIAHTETKPVAGQLGPRVAPASISARPNKFKHPFLINRLEQLIIGNHRRQFTISRKMIIRLITALKNAR